MSLGQFAAELLDGVAVALEHGLRLSQLVLHELDQAALPRQFLARLLELFVVFVDGRLRVSEEAVQPLDLAVLLGNLALVGLLLVLLPASLGLELLAVGLGGLQVTLEVGDLALELLNRRGLLIPLLEGFIERLLLFHQLTLELRNLVSGCLEVGLLRDQLVFLLQSGLFEVGNLLLLLLELAVQLGLVLAERLLIGASRLQLLGQVAVRNLLFVQLGARELEAVLRDLQLRL